MKSLIISFLFILSTSAQTNYYIFSELKGMEDNNSNTHLFPRLYSEWRSGQSFELRNDIYHFDLQTNIDSVFLNDYNFYNTLYGEGIAITDYDFWNNDPSKYIFCFISNFLYESPSAIIQRFDSKLPNHSWLTNPPSVGISKQDDSTLFGTNSMIVNSIDGGWIWNEKNIFDYFFLNLSPHNDKIHFYSNSLDDGSLYRTTDGGNTFLLVDTNSTNPTYPYINQEILFDKDSHFVYRKYQSYNKNYFSVSDNKGDPFSWVIKYFSDNNIFITIDYSQSGHIYLADGRRIYVSDNYGVTFNEYKVLDRKIVGIYKKPNSDKLYAATEYNIYEITPDTTIVIKHLPIDPDLLYYYPLAVGNKWIYDYTFWGDTLPQTGISVISIIGDTLVNNNHYFKTNSSTHYLRIDSLTGRVYQAYISQNAINEFLFLDLTLGVGDTLYDSTSYLSLTVIDEQPFNQWGLNSRQKFFNDFSTSVTHLFTLVQGIGLYYQFSWELTGIELKLRGCVINGIVYGDTNTVVSVNDIIGNIPSDFSLSQNYPNPFNSSTSIEYRVASREYVTLKVYDVLGREVATLVNEEKQSGVYEVEFGASGLASGIYYYQLKAGSYIETKKMIYLK